MPARFLLILFMIPLGFPAMATDQWPRTADEISAGVTPTNYDYPEGHVYRYGANTIPGTTDMSAALNAAALVRETGNGGDIVLAPDIYKVDSEWEIESTHRGGKIIRVLAYGAIIDTGTGAFSGLKISGGGIANGGVHVFGLNIDHNKNSDAIYGINVVGATHTKLVECGVAASDTAAAYAAIRVGNADPADSSTGSLYVQIITPVIRKSSGTNNPPVGILLEGTANAARIVGGQINAVNPVLIRDQSPDGLPNAVVIDGTAMNNFTIAVHVTSVQARKKISGLRIVNNRFEKANEILDTALNGAVSAGGTVLTLRDDPDGVVDTNDVVQVTTNGKVHFSQIASVARNTITLSTGLHTAASSGRQVEVWGGVFKVSGGVKSSNATAPYLAGNHMVSNAGAYINNPNGIIINAQDQSKNNEMDGHRDDTGLVVQYTGTGEHIHTGYYRRPKGPSMYSLMIDSHAGKGIAVSKNPTSLPGVIISHEGTGTEGEIGSNVADNLHLWAIKSIGSTKTHGENLRGEATLSRGTVAVSFGTAEPDAAYFIVATCAAPESIGVSRKTASGFTLTSSNGSSSATVDWVLIR